MKLRIDLPHDDIDAFCMRWKITELSLFGSVLRNDFRPDSDVDVLVRFAPDAGVSLYDLGRMERELEMILGRSVDLVSREAVEQSRNYLRRKAILGAAEIVYAS